MVNLYQKTMKTPAIRSEQTQKYFDRLERERFYGVIEVHFENGRIYRVRKLQNIMGEELERLTNS